MPPPASTPRRARFFASAGSAEGQSAVRRQTQLTYFIIPCRLRNRQHENRPVFPDPENWKKASRFVGKHRLKSRAPPPFSTKFRAHRPDFLGPKAAPNRRYRNVVITLRRDEVCALLAKSAAKPEKARFFGDRSIDAGNNQELNDRANHDCRRIAHVYLKRNRAAPAQGQDRALAHRMEVQEG